MTNKDYTSKDYLTDSEKIVGRHEDGMLSTLLTMGGVVRTSTINSVWQNHVDKISKLPVLDSFDGIYIFDHDDLFDSIDMVTSAGAGVRPAGVRPPRPLSTAHKSPFCEYYEGGGLLKISKNLLQEQVGGGQRGIVHGFSISSRRRMMQTIAKVKRDAELPAFITLTYPNEFPSPKESKRHLEIFVKRLKRKFPNIGVIWKLEPQDRGAPHYHMLAWGVDTVELKNSIPLIWYDIAGNGDEQHLLFHEGCFGNQHCVSLVNSFRGVWAYASKYLGKKFDVAGWNDQWTGRFWAVVNRDNIPFGERRSIDINIGQAVHIMRYQKRFAKVRRRSFPSLSTFCDANQWVDKLSLREVQSKT